MTESTQNMRTESIHSLTLHHVDCMEYMATLPDNAFELAIVDPPYGIGMSGGNVGYKGNNNLERKNWDAATPEDAYFSELKRVSLNQIIWGGELLQTGMADKGLYRVG